MANGKLRATVVHAFLVVSIGAAAAFAAFLVTSDHEIRGYLGPLCATNIVPDGFDPWTGMPHGRSYTCDPGRIGAGSGAPTHVEGDVPEDMVGRRAIPLPLGFLIGVVAVDALLRSRAASRARASERAAARGARVAGGLQRASGTRGTPARTVPATASPSTREPTP